MDDQFYASLMAANAQMASASINAIAQADINADTKKWNAEQATLAWERNKEMWHMTNDYNSPVNQMKRFEEAGLNKNLMFGQGTPGNANNISAPSTNAWNPKNPGFGDMLSGIFGYLSGYQDLRMKDVQISNMEKAGANLELENTRKAIENVLKRNEQDYQPAMIRAKINAMNTGARVNEEKIPVLQSSEVLNRQRTELGKTQQEVMDSQILLNATEAENKLIMRELLKTDANYQKFKKGFIEENGYNPESSPTLMKMWYDAKTWLKNNYKDFDAKSFDD